VRQFVKYGSRLFKNHRGGRAIWQIDYNKFLFLGIFECEKPEGKEREFLNDYLQSHGVLPLANWKIG
jgi:hypothetical protein